jgi:thiol-disulfide isomerase/thioredoxin
MFFAAILLFACATEIFAQQIKPGYEIKATTDYKNAQIYLGNYFGKHKQLADSALSNSQGTAIFKGSKKLAPGIYFIVSPQRVIMFEILMDRNQHFSFVYDSTKPTQTKFTGSPDNDVFQSYTLFLTKISPVLNSLQEQLKTAANKEDSAAITRQLTASAAQLTSYRNDVMNKQPNTMLATLLQIAKIPDRPEMPKRNDGTLDSAYPFYYVKDHYWDNVDFNDSLILYTPFFEPKLEDYFKYYVSADPDSIINEVNYMLLASRNNQQVHTFLLGKFTDKYINPEFMGQDKVFLFLFENFYARGDTVWLNEKQRKYIFDRAYSLMANQINDQAPPLVLTDTSGKTVSLYDIKSPLTFVAFWDPHCSHCQLQIPRLDSFYEAKWKAEGVKVLSVCVNDYVVDDWKKFITEHNLNDWYHAYETKERKTEIEQAKQADYRQLYDIIQTPTFFLLDENKRIVAKGLSLDQYDGLIDKKLKESSR